MHNDYIPLREVCKLINLAPKTIRSWGKAGQIKTFTTPSNQLLYHRQSILSLVNNIPINEEIPQEKTNFVYCRVSSKKQTDDLLRQVECMRTKYPCYTVITDCASGINFKRKGLKTILEQAMSRSIGNVVVAHKDRLCRFGFELIEAIINLGGGTITVLNNQEERKSTEQELAEDLLSIIHIYNCRQMGKRRYTKQRIVQIIEDSSLPNKGTKTNNQQLDGDCEVCLQQNIESPK